MWRSHVLYSNSIAAHFSSRVISRCDSCQDKFCMARIYDTTEMDFEFKLESTGFSAGFRYNVNTKAVRTACFTNDKTRTRARAPISLHSQWIHKYKLLNFVTRFKFAPTGEETWSWIHCLIRAHLTLYQVHNCIRARTQDGDALHNLIVLNCLFRSRCSIDDSLVL